METSALATTKPASTMATHMEFDSEDIIIVEGRISEEWKLRRYTSVINSWKTCK